MKLELWLKKCGKSKAEFSRESGISKATVTRICAGTAIPSREKAKVVFNKTNGQVTPNDFYGIESYDSLPDQAA